jgi:sporulation protein YlmC with PRC-barrel domain
MRQLPLKIRRTGNITMNKHVLALSTALSILAFTPAFAQEQTPAVPAVDCSLPENANNADCMNQQNTQDQTGTGATTTTITPEPDTTTTGQTGTTTEGTTTTTGQTGTQGTDTGTGSTVTTTTTTQGSGQQAAGDIIVPAEQLNGVQLMSASDYIGKTVYDQAGNNIGEVNDLIVSGDGNVEAVILGVGGFLGIGEKDVAVNTQAVQMVQDGDTQRLVVQATKETLEAAPSYDRSNRRYATDTGAVTTETTGSTTAPATGTVDCTLPENANNAACVNQQQ